MAPLQSGAKAEKRELAIESGEVRAAARAMGNAESLEVKISPKIHAKREAKIHEKFHAEIHARIHAKKSREESREDQGKPVAANRFRQPRSGKPVAQFMPLPVAVALSSAHTYA